MNITRTKLYQILIYNKKFCNLYRDAFDIYFYISGYYDSLVNKSIPLEDQEEWMYDFFLFIRSKLEELYGAETFSLSYNHFGEMIVIAEPDPQKGLDLFYKLLNEFVEKYDDDKNVENEIN